MPRFNVTVTATVERRYTVEVEAPGESVAEAMAVKQWPLELPDMQPFGSVIGFDAESEQITWECDECGAFISSHEEYCKRDGLCPKCEGKDADGG